MPWRSENVFRTLNSYSHQPLTIFAKNLHHCCLIGSHKAVPAGIYLLKVNNRNIRKNSEICSQLTKKNACVSRVSIVNFEHVIGGWGFLA